MEGAFKDASARPLSAIADALEGLVRFINTNKKMNECEELRLDAFCNASILVTFLFSSLGLAFKFAEIEYVAKVQDLAEASKTLLTLHSMIDQDVVNGTVKVQGSHSRNLRRIRQGLDLIRALFVQFLKTNDYSLKEAASTAYAHAYAPYHTWAVRAAVAVALNTLPTRDQLLLKLNESRPSAEIKMRRYIDASSKQRMGQHFDWVRSGTRVPSNAEADKWRGAPRSEYGTTATARELLAIWIKPHDGEEGGKDIAGDYSSSKKNYRKLHLSFPMMDHKLTLFLSTGRNSS